MDKAESTPIERTFLLEYARFRMLVESDVMGVEGPGIEFWLLGLLHLVSITSYRLDIFSTPNATWQDKLQVRSRIRQELAARGIVARRLASILRTLLSQGAESNPSLVESYLAADDPLVAILDNSTDTIACAVTRLRLLTVLEHYRDELRAATVSVGDLDQIETASSVGQQEAHRIALGDFGQKSWDAFGQIDRPDLLCDLALHAENDGIRYCSLTKLQELDVLHGPAMRQVLAEIITNEEDVGVRHLAQFLHRKLCQEPEPQPKPSKPLNLRKSVLNPDLEKLAAWNMLDPADPDQLDLIAYLYHVGKCTQFAHLLPKTYPRRVSHYRLTHKLVRREYDLDVLEDYVLHGENSLLRVFAFTRLTGWNHWEDCDLYSHLTYSCPKVPDYSDERALRLCRALQCEFGDRLPPYNPHQPMCLDDVLCEGAYYVNELLRYGRNFFYEASYLGRLAREEAAALGVEREGIEFWLLGLMRYALLQDSELSSDVFHDTYYTKRDTKACRELLERRHIIPQRFERYLRGILAEGATSDPALLPSYFAAANRRVEWHRDPFRGAELLDAILTYPTETICLALTRLRLVITLEARLPEELRPRVKTVYHRGMFRDQEEIDLTDIDTSRTTDLSFAFSHQRITHIDLSPLDATHVTSMDNMFYASDRLQDVNLTGLHTPNLTTMGELFWGCNELRSIDLSSLDTSHVTDMNRLFLGCRSLERIELDCLDTSSLEDAAFMFRGCSSLRTIDLSSLDLSRVKDIRGLFNDCSSLEYVDLPDIDAPQLDDMSELFRGCSSLREVRFAKLRAPQATVIAALFEGCSKLRSVDLGDAYLPRLSHVGDNFEGCVALESWRLPAGWPARDSDLPKPTAPCGLWWAVDAQRWMDLAEIRQRLRDGIVDTYTSEPRESLS